MNRTRPDENTTDKRAHSRASKWKPEFDEELKRDWPNGVSLAEFARRFGYTSKSGPQKVRRHAVRLGLMEWEK